MSRECEIDSEGYPMFCKCPECIEFRKRMKVSNGKENNT